MDAYQHSHIHCKHYDSRLRRSLALLECLGTEVDSCCYTFVLQRRWDSCCLLQLVPASDDTSTRERMEHRSNRLALAILLYIGVGYRRMYIAHRLQNLEHASRNRQAHSAQIPSFLQIQQSDLYLSRIGRYVRRIHDYHIGLLQTWSSQRKFSYRYHIYDYWIGSRTYSCTSNMRQYETFNDMARAA